MGLALLVGTRSRASRRRLSDNDIRCSASDRRWFPARPAQHVHRRRNNGKGRIQNDKWRVETCNAGRAGAHRPSKALLADTAVGRLTAAPHGSASRRYAYTPIRRPASPASSMVPLNLGGSSSWMPKLVSYNAAILSISSSVSSGHSELAANSASCFSS